MGLHILTTGAELMSDSQWWDKDETVEKLIQ
jgi:hypothetical protein